MPIPHYKKTRKKWDLRSYLPTALLFLALVTVGFLADRQHNIIQFQSERDQVRTQIEALGNQVESRLSEPIQAARGLVAALAMEPDMEQGRFNWLSSRILVATDGVRSVAAARDLVVNLVYPMEGNESAYGLDYKNNKAQRGAAYHVRETGQFILAGPVDLVQGGRAFIGRFPVFTENDGTHEFWGILSVVIDIPTLYSNAGLTDSDIGLEVAITGRDGKGAEGEQFMGPVELLTDNPVSTDVLFPNGTWRLSARPVGGWGATISLKVFRSFLIAAVVGATTMAALANVMFVQRQQTIRELQQREEDLERARSEVETQALHDHLTGLPNRRYLDQVCRRQTENAFIGLIQLDLDGFKEVNDTHGHLFGDQLLVEISARLSKTLHPGTFLARSGGDEFVVVCKTSSRRKPRTQTDREYLEETATRLIDSVRSPFFWDKQMCQIGISAGIHLINANKQCAVEEWLTQADHAMYVAKKAGRNCFAFSSSNTNRLENRVFKNEELLEALSRKQIQPHYQLQFGRDGVSIVAVEALARWIHPVAGILYPEDFMDRVFNLKIEGEVDQIIFEQAVRDLASWDDMGLYVPRISVNTTFRRLGDPKLIDIVENAKVQSDRFAFELLESIDIDDGDEVHIQNIEALKSRGFSIEVDDFGTGRSSVASLLKLRPQCLKIDKGLVQAAPKSSSNRRLLATIADMGHALNIEVCAEGIETEEQLRTAQSVGCTRFQGFLLARPMSAKDLECFLLSGELAEYTNALALG